MAAVLAGATAAVLAGASTAVEAGAGAMAGAAVAAAGGVASGAGVVADSSLLPQALRASTAANEAATNRVRVIFINISSFRVAGLDGNFEHLPGLIRSKEQITTGFKLDFHGLALP